MSMTVRQLISALKKMPLHAKVAVCAHDQDPEAGEFDGAPQHVEEASPKMRERGYQVVIKL